MRQIIILILLTLLPCLYCGQEKLNYDKETLKGKVRVYYPLQPKYFCLPDLEVLAGGFPLLTCDSGLYIPGIKCNLLSIGQLLEKGFEIHLEDKILRVVDANGVLILKAPMAANRTFKVELKVMEHRCLATASRRMVMALPSWASQFS